MGVDVLTIDGTPLDVLGVRPDYVVNVTGAGRLCRVESEGMEGPHDLAAGHTRESSG